MTRAVLTALAALGLAGCAAEAPPPVEGVAFANESMVRYDPALDAAYIPARTVMIGGQPVTLAAEVVQHPDFETIPDRRGLFGTDLRID